MPIPHREEDLVFHYDAEAAESGWSATASDRSQVGSASLPAVDLPTVAIRGLTAARQLQLPEIRAPFEVQLPSFFDPAILDRLEPLSWAVWYGESRRRDLETTVTAGKLSVVTLQKATAVRARMLDVAEYTLRTHPTANRLIASIRSGQGHADLGQDLMRLSGVYATYRATVEQGGLHYDPADEQNAKALAGQIAFELGESQTKELTALKLELAQAFVVLRRDYTKVRRYAAAFWDDDDFLPSLFA